MSDIEFVDGLIVKKPHENAPDFVKCSISIKRADLGNWLRGKSDEWINVDVKESRNGKWYAAVNDFKPSQDQMNQAKQAAQGTAPSGMDDFESEEIPFMRPHDEYFG